MSPIPVTEITEAARLAILTGLASQFKVAANGGTLNLQPLLQIAERLGFRQEPIAPPPRPIPPPPKPPASRTIEDEYNQWRYRE